MTDPADTTRAHPAPDAPAVTPEALQDAPSDALTDRQLGDGQLSQVQLSDAQLTELRGRLRGTVVSSADADWDRARQPWHTGVDQHPAAVVLLADRADATAVVAFAVEHGLQVAVQARGHGATQRLDGCLLVRATALDELTVDVAARTARVGAGVLWGELCGALDGTGLLALAGSAADVSVVGLTLGGGLSWFGRSFGTPAASLRAVELVDATGTARRVTATEDPDLFWALRGGGGDFALVTAVELDLFPAPALTGGKIVFPGESAAQVLAAWAALTRTAPDALTTYVTLMNMPDMPPLPPEVRGQSFASVDVVLVGPLDAADELLAPLRATAPVLRDTVRPLNPSEIGTVSEEPTEPGPPMLAIAQGLDELTDAVLAHVVATAGPGSALLGTQLRHLGGAQATGDDSSGPGTVLRPGFALTAMGPAFTPEMAAAVTQGLTAAMSGVPRSPHGLGLTFTMPGQGVTDAYGPAVVERLATVKRAVDPAETFRSNVPVLGD